MVGLSIGTRTDSINFETLEYLAELSEKSEIWVEYGIQSIFDETLNKINRGHDFKNIETWIRNTKKYNLNICGHLIYGLPDETDEMMQKSFDKSLELGINSLKIHPLYIVKKTALANQFKRGKFKPISEEKYIHNLIVSLKKLPENISVQRLTAGIENDSLLAPKWCLNKQESLKKIRAELEKNGIRY